MTIASIGTTTTSHASRRVPLRGRLLAQALGMAVALASAGCVRQESSAVPDSGRSRSSRDGVAASRDSTTTPFAADDPRLTDMRAGVTPATVGRTITAGTAMTARLDTTLDSSLAMVGDDVRATLISDVRGASGDVALPAGTVLSGDVTDVQPARKVRKMASLAFRFHLATLPNGTTADISASEGADGRGWTRKQGAIIGGSAAGGAVLGQVVGEDTQSTLAGAIVGGAIATGVILSNKGEDVVISSGSTMALTLDGDVTVKPPSAS